MGGGSSDSEGSDAERGKLYDPGPQVMSLLKPVSLTMALVIWLVGSLGTEDIKGGFSELMVYQEEESDSVGTKAGGVLLNALAMVGMLVVVTSLMLCLYMYRCYRIIYGWLLLSVASMIFTFGGFVLRKLLEVYALPLDELTLTLLLLNAAVAGTLLVFWQPFGLGGSPPKTAQQGFLVLVSALMAWSATRLPEWSTWGVLGAVALWDVVAVLSPQGPLKVLVEEAERRDEQIPGLVYEGEDIKLGLGDFIFYSLLVGRASLTSAAAATSCVVGVLAGLCATLALLPVYEKALPALPISIAIGTLFYFAAVFLVTPLAQFGVAHSFFL